MCYYNGQKVTRAEYIRLMSLERELKNFSLNKEMLNGFEYGDVHILKPTEDKSHFDIVTAHWEFLPDWVNSVDDLKEFRQGKKDPETGKPLINKRTGKPLTGYTTLDAMGERLLTSPVFKDAARNGRCIMLSSGFTEFKHVKEVAYPHYITLKEQYLIEGEYFYMAAVYKPWTDQKTGKTIDTVSMVTAPGNDFMANIHNKTRQGPRMPTILTEKDAHKWMFGDLSDKEIIQMATHQIPSDWMTAHSVDRDFKTSETPTKKQLYPDLVDLFS